MRSNGHNVPEAETKIEFHLEDLLTILLQFKGEVKKWLNLNIQKLP